MREGWGPSVLLGLARGRESNVTNNGAGQLFHSELAARGFGTHLHPFKDFREAAVDVVLQGPVPEREAQVLRRFEPLLSLSSRSFAGELLSNGGGN